MNKNINIKYVHITVAMLIIINMMLGLMSSAYAAPEQTKLPVPDIVAQSAIMLDMKTGKLIYEKNSKAKMYPASTTKILTGIIALEQCEDLSQVITVPREAIEPITLEDSHMGIYIGEELSLEQLINGMLIYSANDAANTLAIHIAGSFDGFAQLMNEKAAEIGAVNSHFVNPHGFHDDNHYTTAEDMSKIAMYAMQNEKFREIVKTPKYVIPATNKYKEDRILTQTNHLISKYRNASFFYKPAIGIKTGYTSLAGNCLVAAAEKDNTQLLSVVMKSQGTGSFTDTTALFEYGFSNFKYIDIAVPGDIVEDSPVYEAKNNVRVSISVKDNVSALLPVDTDVKTQIIPDVKLKERIDAPLNEGDVVGSISYTYNGEVVGQSELVALNKVERDNILWVIHKTVDTVKNPLFIGGVVVLAGALTWLKTRGGRNGGRKSGARRRTGFSSKYR